MRATMAGKSEARIRTVAISRQQMGDQFDRARATFIERLGGAAWTDPRAYDLALDTAVLGIQGAVNAIIQATGARVAEDRGTLAP
jgi:hypothetical protein